MGVLKTFGVQEGQGKYHEEAIYSLALLYNVIDHEMTVYLKDFDLTPGKLNILLAIKHQGKEEGIRQVEVSKFLIVTPSNMTKLIDKLEKDGLVARSSLKGDRRVNILKVTEKGSKLVDRVWEGYNAKLKSLLSRLDANKQKHLASLLIEWLERLK